ncbi:MAG: PAS domain S-box protein [Syntrophobacteraceae bacterium]
MIETRLRRLCLVVVPVMILLAGSIFFVGYLYTSNETSKIEAEARKQLLTIADVKRDDIVKWRSERLGDGCVLSSVPMLMDFLDDSPEKGKVNHGTIRALLSTVKDSFGYEAVLIADSNGNTRLALPEGKEVCKESFSFVKNRDLPLEPFIADFYTCAASRENHLEVVVPVWKGQEKATLLGVLVLRIDLYKQLYPLIETWPVSSATAETFMVRQNKHEILYLSELKNKPNAALSFRVPLNTPNLPAAAVLGGHEGIVEGVDYRGVPVVAAGLRIPGSPWHLISKIDKDEAYLSIKENRNRAVVWGSLALLFVGTGFSLVLMRQNAAYYREQYLAESERLELAERYIEKVKEKEIAEARLKESEENYRTIFENTGTALAISDEHGDILLANREFEILSGYSQQELSEKMNWQGFLGLDAVDKIRDLPWDARSLQGSNEFEFKNKAGQTRLTEIRVNAFPNSSQYIVSLSDITERKRAEQAVRASEEKFSTVFYSNPAIMCISTLARGVYSDVNETFCRFTGYAREELIGKSALDLGLWVDPSERERMLGTLDRSHIVRDQALRWRKKTGEILNGILFTDILSDDGEPRLMSTIIDVSELQETRVALSSSEAKYRELVQNANSMILKFDTRGRITFINEYAQQFFGFAEDDILGRSAIGTIVPETETGGRDLKEMMADLFKNHDNYPSSENENICRDGKRVWVSWTNKAILDKDGALTGLLCIGGDITEKKNLEQQYRHALKMEAVGRLAGGVAHDFNNILGIIIGFCDLAALGSEKEEILGNIGEIKQAASRAATLVRQLLAFSRKQVVSPRILNLNTILKDIDKILRRTIGEDVAVATILSPDIYTVKVDPAQAEQVMLNLAINARDAMPEGGKLTIETANVYLDDAYCLRHADVAPGKYVMLAMSDTGTGISDEVKSRIFEPFFTTKGVGKGTGLGLASVYGMVKQSGGHIWWYSEVGRGTTFKIYLPASAETEEEVDNVTGQPAHCGGSETILVVEDDAKLRKVIRMTLKAVGYRVLEAQDGEEAFGIVSSCEGPIHLIITDVIMPKMTGRQLEMSVKDSKPEIKFLFMSGYTANAIVHHGVLDDGIAFLPKPFSTRELAARVRTELDR